MLTIENIVVNLDQEGKKPGSPSYAAAVKGAILFHFELDESDLSDEQKSTITSRSKTIAQQCKKCMIQPAKMSVR